jgi:hypothetical protein
VFFVCSHGLDAGSFVSLYWLDVLQVWRLPVLEAAECGEGGEGDRAARPSAPPLVCKLRVVPAGAEPVRWLRPVVGGGGGRRAAGLLVGGGQGEDAPDGLALLLLPPPPQVCLNNEMKWHDMTCRNRCMPAAYERAKGNMTLAGAGQRS